MRKKGTLTIKGLLGNLVYRTLDLSSDSGSLRTQDLGFIENFVYWP